MTISVDTRMLVVALVLSLPFDLAIPEEGFTGLYLRPLMCVVAVVAILGIASNRAHLQVAVVRAAALAAGGIVAAALLADDRWLAFSVVARLLVVLLVLVFVSSTEATSREDAATARAIAVMVITSSVIGLVVLIAGRDVLGTQYLLGKISSTNSVERLTRPFSQANIAAMVLASASAYLLTRWAAARDTTRTNLLAGAGGVIGVVATVLTLSRGGLIALVFGLAVTSVLVWSRDRTLAAPVALVAVIAGSAIIWFDSWGDRVATQTVDLRSPGRLDIWSQAIDAFQSQPVVGVGPGHFGRFWLDNPLDDVVAAPHAHNLVLELLATTGLLGVLLTLPLALLIIRAVWSGWSTAVLPARVGLVVLLFHTIVDYPLVFTSSGVWFAVLVGINLRRPEVVR